MKKRKVLITGGTGFVGQNLVNHLLSDDYQITVTSTGSEPEIPNVHKVLYTGLDGIDWQETHGQDVVIHLMANNDTLCVDETEMMRANLHGPILLFSNAFIGGCKKFVYASSTAVYGNSPAPYDENTKIAPLNVYGESKAQFDKFAMQFAKEKSVSVTGFRFCNIYGPGEHRKGRRMSMIGQLIKKMRNGETINLFKDGTQRRDWVHVNDVVAAIVLAMNYSPNSGEIYNLGSGNSYTFNEVLKTVQDQCSKTWSTTCPKVNYIDCPFAETYQSYTECDIEKARRKLGYSPGFDLQSGVQQYVENFNVDSSWR